MTERIFHRESRRKVSSTTEICNEDCSADRPGYGLMIALRKDGACELSFCADAHFPQVHPNSYAPASLSDVKSLGGGGSGVAVFGGRHPELGEIVMKHGGHKDLAELFALATIAKELEVRGTKLNPEAAHHLKKCIPEFRMIYISPFHLGEKRKDLFRKLNQMYKYASHNSQVLLPKSSNARNHPPKSGSFLKRTQCQRCAERTTSGKVATRQRDIAVYACEKMEPSCSVHLLEDSLTLVVPERQTSSEAEGLAAVKRCVRLQGDGYEMLKALVNDLLPLMKENQWKFTLAQKRIGGDEPRTGNSWLYTGQLEGRMLDNLITQKIRIVQHLASLTTPEEQDHRTLKDVLEEVAIFEESEVNETPLSKEADSFVGNSIKKNFQEETGRFPVLMLLGKQFREYYEAHLTHHHEKNAPGCICSEGSCSMVLTPEEEMPAHHLGALTRPGALMGDTFENVPAEPCVLDTMHPHYWRNLLKVAVQPRINSYMNKTSTMALTRIWTCGFSDAGLHNLFLSEDSLSLFDLGQPTLNSAPGFLTKFMFSFFHTIGMEEMEGSKGAEWVNCFVANEDNGKLRLTQATEKKLANAYRAFESTLDRMVDELFDGDDSLRWLLLQFVTLQLFSDASFCLQRWTVKGGGRGRDSNHQRGIEKWLWRALWDMYVAFDINSRESWSRLNVQHPSHQEDSAVSSDMVDAAFSNRRKEAMLDRIRKSNSFHLSNDPAKFRSVRSPSG